MTQPHPTALLVIDVQRAFMDDTPRPFEADTLVDRINALSQMARTQGAAVIYVQHERDVAGIARGSEPWQLDRDLQTQPGDHFVGKTTPDAFLRTPLQSLLDELKVTHVAVCGYASEFCVDSTTRGAAARGYAVTLVADAHTTHDRAHATAAAIRAHANATLQDIESFGPTIRAVPVEAVRFAAA